MKGNMIDFDGHDYSRNPMLVVVCLALSLALKLFHIVTLNDIDKLTSIAVSLVQFPLICTGLIAFYWAWKERVKRNKNKPL